MSIAGTRFLLNGEPFPWTGVSFFNAIYNPDFNASSEARRAWLARFRAAGVNVVRVWCQWDSNRGFVDGGPDRTLYTPDGRLRDGPLATLKALLADADAAGVVVEVVLFSHESYREGIRIAADADERAVAALTRELKPWRNAVFQIWNEHHDARVLPLVQVIRSLDPQRLVTSSPGYAGVLGTRDLNEALDFLTPHTSRQGRPWELAPREIESLLREYKKPVVDDEPARCGTAQFGGPKGSTDPSDHIRQIQAVRSIGGHIVYHHDMFQTGYGSPACPPHGVPDPSFSPYHSQVFDYLAREASRAGDGAVDRVTAGLSVTALGTQYAPDSTRVVLRQPRADAGGSTSVRNIARDHLEWKRQGYFQRNRDLGQTFTAARDFTLSAIVLRTGPSDAAVLAGGPGAPLFVQFFEVRGDPRIDDGGTPSGMKARHGFSTNHRCDDVILGVTYQPIRIVSGGVFPRLAPSRDDDGQATGNRAGCGVYLRWSLDPSVRLACRTGTRYAFMVGIAEPGRGRGFTLANANAAGADAPPGPGDLHDRYADGWGLRREGDGTLPPAMHPADVPPGESSRVETLLREALFPEGEARYRLLPTTDGYPDVDTYRDLEFYIEAAE